MHSSRPTQRQGDIVIADGKRFKITHICDGWEYEFKILDKKTGYQDMFYNMNNLLSFIADDAQPGLGRVR